MTIPFSDIALVLVIICSISLGWYVYRFLLSFVNLKDDKDQELEDRTADLLDTYRRQDGGEEKEN